MPEFIFKINEAVVDNATGEAVMKPEYVQRLVRCANCKYYRAENPRDGYYYPCSYWVAQARTDGFCSYGKERVEHED